jgi:outer membrane protein assembly factor BamB
VESLSDLDAHPIGHLGDPSGTYRPSDPERKLAPLLQPAAFGGTTYAVTRRLLTSPPADRTVEFSITAVNADGVELWHAPMPRATRPLAPPMVDSQGHIWFFSEDAMENVGRWGNYAYRISPDGRVLWGVSLRGAIEDGTPFIIGLRTAAAALDRYDNAYYVVGKSAASIDPEGKFRWGRMLGQDDSEERCGLPLVAPLVASDRVFFAEACTGVVVFDLHGNDSLGPIGHRSQLRPERPLAVPCLASTTLIRAAQQAARTDEA